MMRALWTAASGMLSQQTNVDTISNNLANVNTTGYKKEVAEFKSLLYQTIQRESTNSEGGLKPVGVQVGLGVKNVAISSHFTQGSLLESGNTFDFAIEGKGFFMLRDANGNTVYTKNGSFNATISTEGSMIANASGMPLLGTDGQAIIVGKNYDTARLSIDNAGNICYPDESNNPQPIGITIGLAQFNNPAGLEKMSGSLLKATEASGEARLESMDEGLVRSRLKQGYLEGSNVQVVDEMVNLIVAQRAYEMNSKAIQAADTMLQQANNIRS